MSLTLAVSGALIGMVLALTGAGGGILAIPLLVLVLGIPVQQAGPVGLAAVGLASALGALIGLREGIVRYRAALLMGTLGMLAAPVGVMVAQRVPQRPLMFAFGAVMMWVAWGMLRPTPTEASSADGLACQTQAEGGRLSWTSRCARAIASTGVLSGALSGLLGVGGGFVIVPALRAHTNLDFRSVQATSLAVIALVSVSGVGAAMWQGSLQAAIALPFAGGAVVALLVGRRWGQHLPPEVLKRLFGGVSLLVALGMMGKAAWMS